MTLEIRKILILSVCRGLMTTSLSCKGSAPMATAPGGGDVDTYTNGGTNATLDTKQNGSAEWNGNGEWNGKIDEGTDICANLDLTLERQPTTIMLPLGHQKRCDVESIRDPLAQR